MVKLVEIHPVFVGDIGGWIIHQTTFFQRMEQWMIKR